PSTLESRTLSLHDALPICRTRQLRWESRLIDIDILFYDEMVLNDPDLVIPHPYIQKRKFTLVPLAEIAPKYKHPVLLKTVEQLRSEEHTSELQSRENLVCR